MILGVERKIQELILLKISKFGKMLQVLEQEMNTAAVFLHLINMCWGKSHLLMLFLIVVRVTWTLFTYVKHVTSVTCIAHDTAVMSMETLSGFSLSFSDTEE